MGFEGGINLYAYALNNPLNLTDPNGTSPLNCISNGLSATPYGLRDVFPDVADKCWPACTRTRAQSSHRARTSLRMADCQPGT
ncbi:hypothetical protein [Tardibacter chloracetimidivorans]|uniref:hypothetical protein n=1 Tax=Tardibacter chloracetimidivorans TaxID=1921510 RepID=UPI001D04ED7E